MGLPLALATTGHLALRGHGRRARLYEKAGLDPRKVIGITSLDTVRANKFVHEARLGVSDSENGPVGWSKPFWEAPCWLGVR